MISTLYFLSALNASNKYTLKTDYGDITFWKRGNVVTLEGYFTNVINNVSFNIPEELVPKYDHAIINVIFPSYPYNPIGTAWFYGDGRAILYSPSGQDKVYLCGTYITISQLL